MAPPIGLEHCPKSIQENPLPSDICSRPIDPVLPPKERWNRLSVFVDQTVLPFKAARPGDYPYQLTLGSVFRPRRWVSLGLHGSFNFHNEVNILARAGFSFNLQREGMIRPEITALLGLQHLYGQERVLTNQQGAQPLRGTLLNTGIELALNIRTLKNLSLAPVLGLQFIPPASIDENPARTRPEIGVTVGARLSFDFFSVGDR